MKRFVVDRDHVCAGREFVAYPGIPLVVGVNAVAEASVLRTDGDLAGRRNTGQLDGSALAGDDADGIG